MSTMGLMQGYDVCSRCYFKARVQADDESGQRSSLLGENTK